MVPSTFCKASSFTMGAPEVDIIHRQCYPTTAFGSITTMQNHHMYVRQKVSYDNKRTYCFMYVTKARPHCATYATQCPEHSAWVWVAWLPVLTFSNVHFLQSDFVLSCSGHLSASGWDCHTHGESIFADLVGYQGLLTRCYGLGCGHFVI